LLDMHFNDARTMLRLPRPEVGIETGCNIALSGMLCNILSGISSTIYKPARLLHEVQSKRCSGEAFRGLVDKFFPFKPPGAVDFPQGLYKYARNPLAHSLGIGSHPQVVFSRVLHSPHPDRGWDDNELDDLESGRFQIKCDCIEIASQKWTMHCDRFYFDV